ncbi:hypothetical protein A0256_04515 [Mucilaginibacter sp. PAMC 26640]|nr:hypothetical protein A0256_04515 [Mucilaginibacter sp. PAMC 26640]
MIEKKFIADPSLEQNYINRKVRESKYSITIGLTIFLIVGTAFYLNLDNTLLTLFNVIIIAVPISIYIHMSTFKQAIYMNRIISSIVVNDNDYQISTFAFKTWFINIPAVNKLKPKNTVSLKRVDFPFNEDGLKVDKMSTMCLMVDGQDFYLLHQYFSATLNEILNFSG